MNLIQVPPPIENFLMEDYWAIHEAAFVFTQWPKQDLFQSYDCYPLKNVFSELTMDRSYVYLPEGLKIEPKIYGKPFETIYYDLKEAVESRSLGSKMQRVFYDLYFVTPKNAIIWALLKGYILPKYLQKVIGICQNQTVQELQTKTRNTLPTKVREKIIAQLLLALDPNQTRDELCRKVIQHFDFLRDEKVDSRVPEERDLTATRKNLNTLYDSAGRRGAKKKNSPEKQVDKYTVKAIPEIINEDFEGNLSCNFSLLREAMLHAAYFKIISMETQQIKEINQVGFSKAFLKDDIVRLYLQKGDEYSLTIAKGCAGEAWDNSTFLTHDRDRLRKYLKDRI